MKTSIALALVWFIGPCTPSSDCWDPNGDAVCDPSEDLNGDGSCDVLDCDGAAGLDGLNCWDLDDSGACDGAEDRDGSGFCDADDCQGDPGPSGDPGAAGATGDAGPAGSSCTVAPTATGALITCDDGTSEPVTDGADGPAGPPGLTGQDGTSCTVVDSGGSATISCDDGTSATVSDGQDGTSASASGVREVIGGDLLTVSDVALHITGGGTLTLPDAPPDGAVLHVAYDGGQALRFAGVANSVVGIGSAPTGTGYDVVSADPALITLLFVQGQNRWYVNAL